MILHSKSMSSDCLMICMRPRFSCNKGKSNFDFYVLLNIGGWDDKKSILQLFMFQIIICFPNVPFYSKS